MTAQVANPFSAAQVERLCRLAPLFDISLTFASPEQATLVITDPATQVPEILTLSPESALRRAMSEICSRTVRWVFYHGGEPASRVFFDHTDARLIRISELYRRWKASGCPQ